MIILENSSLRAEFTSLGGEIRRLYHKEKQREEMWSGDASIWRGVSPVLFPIVGRLYEERYTFKGKEYPLKQHGFLRNQELELSEKTDTRLSFQLKSNPVTKEVYPFDFIVTITYELIEESLKLTWTIMNSGEEPMFYSIGGHPSFLLTEDHRYSIHLKTNEKYSQYRFNQGYLGEKFIPEAKAFIISKALFDDFATYVFTGVDEVILRDETSLEDIVMNCEGFEYLAFWMPIKDEKMTPFLCIEPWFGVTDEWGGYPDLSAKKSIRQLQKGESETFSYTINY